MNVFPHFAKACLCSLLFSASASADDTSLYADVLPDDASFVRFVGFEGKDNAAFAGFTFDLIAQDAGKYIPVSASKLTNVTSGSYTTVLRDDDGTLRTINEAHRSRQSKVALLLVNGTQTPLELRLADGSVAVIKDVNPATSGLREVNPVAITLGVFAMDQQIPLATFDVALRRGQNLSFVADDTGVRLIENQFAALAK
ncbi:MAG: alginate O-acetyltransferase AlgF [Aliishimia sp.]